jgi:hypothetical protein
MSEPRKHHYVPRFYQRGFMADASKKMWVYQKNRKPQRYSTKKTGMEIDLYAFRNAQGEVDLGSVEKELALLDGGRVFLQVILSEKRSINQARQRLLLCFAAALAPLVGVFAKLLAEHNDVVEIASGFSGELHVNCARIAEDRVVQKTVEESVERCQGRL